MAELYNQITPGEYLEHEFLQPLGLSQSRLARDIDVPVTRINNIINGKRVITADTALRLAEYFGTSAQMWLNLQDNYDLRVAMRSGWDEAKKRIRPLSDLHKEPTHSSV